MSNSWPLINNFNMLKASNFAKIFHNELRVKSEK